ncbi:MAG TPA: fused MFS/spermidine synthase [Anaeromyxobacteraceae bacterium]
MRWQSRDVTATACVFVSGVAALLYEIVWLRLLGLAFGQTVHTVTSVLAAYMGGLALGSIVLGRRADRVRRPLRLYGLLELGIGLFCLATPWLFGGLNHLYLALLRSWAPSPLATGALRLALSLAVLVPPTALMGATLPLLSRALVREPGRAGADVGTLYALNTWGAVVGTAATGFWLLPLVGVRATVVIGVALDLAVAGVALALARRERDPVALPEEPRAAEAPEPPAPEARAPTRTQVVVALVATGVSGAASIAYEIAWTRALSLVLGSSTYAFTAMLATFLVGLTLGAFVISRGLRRWRPGLSALGIVEGSIGLAALALLPALGELPVLTLAVLQRTGVSHEGALLAQFAMSFLLMIVPTLLIGATFPLVLAALSRGLGSVGRDVGRVYGANAIGTIVGSALAGFALVPLAGIQNAIVIAAGANVAAATALLAVSAPRWRALAVVFPAGFAALALLVPRWDATLMTGGAAVYAPGLVHAKDLTASLTRGRALLFYEEGLHTTVSVQRSGAITSLRLNGKTDGSNGRDMIAQRLAGHLGPVLAPGARRALVIGLGTGVTAGALAQHPLERIDVAELEPAVVDASRFFEAENRHVLSDPRVVVKVEDGRQVLAAGQEPWDIIVSEPSNPWIAGVGSLFTRELYELARARLSERGVMVQWFQGYSMRREDMQMVANTFLQVFPHVSLWQAVKGDYFLVATPDELELDLSELDRRYPPAAAVRADLGRYLPWPRGLLLHHLLTEHDLRRYARGAALNTDDHPRLEFAAPRSLYLDTIEVNDQHLRWFRSVERPRVAGAAAELGAADARIELARQHWILGNGELAAEQETRLGALASLPRRTRMERVRLLFLGGAVRQARADLEALEAEAPGDAAVGRYLRAARAFPPGSEPTGVPYAAMTLNPAEAYDAAGRLFLEHGTRRGSNDLIAVAAEHFEEAVRHDPQGWSLFNRLAKARLALGQLDLAVEAYQRAVGLAPRVPELRYELGLVFEEQKRTAEAYRAHQEALALRPGWDLPARRLAVLSLRY